MMRPIVPVCLPRSARILSVVILMGAAGVPASLLAERPAEQEIFWKNLQALCGKAFEGRLIEGGGDGFTGKRLVMHVRRCDLNQVLIPFHVGDNRSRTWVLTRHDGGLRLKHDHRHEDGGEDKVTQYGGDTAGAGGPERQEFRADAQTAQVIPAAKTNVWFVEVVPGRMFAYGLRREGTDRRFRVEFDLTRPVDAPPAPWGHM